MNTYSTKHFLLKTGVLCALIFLLAACTGNTGSATATTATPNTTVNPTLATTPTPALSLGPQSCPATVQSVDYWSTIIPTQAGTSNVENIVCGYLRGVASLQALVTVRIDGSGDYLDVYVYDNITAGTPNQLFKLEGLAKGTAKLSAYNTVLTAEVDPNSSINANQPDAALQQDLYREFKWSASVATLVQVAFPGIYPDLTRYQAETDQQQVNQGHDAWKVDAKQVAQSFGVSRLHWASNAPTTIVSGGGLHDVNAVVKLQSGAPAGGGIQLTLSRLEGNTNGGIWIVIAAQTSGASITAPASLGSFTSPIAITGTGSAFEGVIGTITVLDHLNNDLGHTTVKGATGNGQTTFTTSLSYNRTFTTGAEEGVLMLNEPSNADSSIAGAVFVKVLID